LRARASHKLDCIRLLDFDDAKAAAHAFDAQHVSLDFHEAALLIGCGGFAALQGSVSTASDNWSGIGSPGAGRLDLAGARPGRAGDEDHGTVPRSGLTYTYPGGYI
jgi:hypothetical protein